MSATQSRPADTSVRATEVPERDGLRRTGRVLMTVDGVFLVVVGAIQVSLELLGFVGAGPYATIFGGSPYTIGWVENHALALLIGALFLTVSANETRRHVLAMAVHAMLAVANVVFWSSFVAFGTVALGVAATVAHIAFVVAHAGWLAAARRAAVTS